MENLNESKKKKASAYMAELAEIDKQSSIVAMEAKINKLAEMIESKNQRLSMVSEDENLSELIDKKRVKMMEREIKEIERAKMKLEKLYEKMTGSKKKEVVDEEMKDDSMDEEMKKSMEDDTIDEEMKDKSMEDDLNEGAKKYFGVFRIGGSMGQGNEKLVYSFVDKEEAKQRAKRLRNTLSPGEKSYYGMRYIVKPTDVEPESVKGKSMEDDVNEQFLRMQKLAGIISEEEYKKKLNEKESYDLKVGSALNSLKGLNVSYMYEEGKPVNTKIASADVGETKDGKEFININFSADTGMTLTDDDFVAWGSQRQKGFFPVSDSRKFKQTVLSKEFFEKLSPILKNLGISPKGLVNDSTSGGIFNAAKKYAERETNQLKIMNSVLPKNSGTNWKYFRDGRFKNSGRGLVRFVSSEGNRLKVKHEGQDKNVYVYLSFVRDDEGFDQNSLKQPIKDFFKKAFNIDINDVVAKKGYS